MNTEANMNKILSDCRLFAQYLILLDWKYFELMMNILNHDELIANMNNS